MADKTLTFDAAGIQEAREAADGLAKLLKVRWQNEAKALADDMEKLSSHLATKAAEIRTALEDGKVAISLVRFNGEAGKLATSIDMYCATLESVARIYGQSLMVRDKVIGGTEPDQQ